MARIPLTLTFPAVVFCVAVCAALTSCSSGNGGASSPPSAGADIFTVPRNGSTTVSGLLTNDTDPDGDSLVLVSVGTPQKGVITSSGGGSYTYAANANAFGADEFNYVVADAKGNAASGSITVNITPGWGTAAAFNALSNNNPASPQLVLDASGNLTAAWLQADTGGFAHVWVNRFSVQSGWGTPTRVDTVDSQNASALQLIADANGPAFVVWQQVDTGVTGVWASRWSDGNWSTAVAIDLSANSASQPVVAIDALGRLTVLYQQNDGGEINLYAQHFVPATGWVTPEQIDNTGTALVSYTCLTDQQNNVTATFLHSGGVADMWANHCTPGTGWGTARKVELDDTGAAELASIHPDLNGNVTLLWRQSDATRANAWATRFTLQGNSWVNGNTIEAQVGAVAAGSPSGVVDSTGRVTATAIIDVAGTQQLFYNQDPGTGTWAGATRLDTAAGSVSAVKSVVDDFNGVHVVWTQSDTTRVDLWSASFIPGTGWSAPARIDSEDLGDVGAFEVGVTDAGNVMASWLQSDGTVMNLWSNRYERGTGWSTASRVEAGAGDVVSQEVAATSDAGATLVVWIQKVAGNDRLFAARYSDASGWGTALQLDDGLTGAPAAVRGAVDATGAVSVTWQQGPSLYSVDFR